MRCASPIVMSVVPRHEDREQREGSPHDVETALSCAVMRREGD